MRKIIVATFSSLDGVMQAPGGPQEDPTGGFTLGGWTAPYFDAALGGTMGEIFSRPFDLLLGRKTYDIFAAHWPYVTDPNDPIAGVFNRVTKYVASRATPTPRWQNSRLLGTGSVAMITARFTLVEQGTIWPHPKLSRRHGAPQLKQQHANRPT